jgi:catechol 2,3-dioxygenase-like lactoylglutathione lyase family enzyme
MKKHSWFNELQPRKNRNMPFDPINIVIKISVSDILRSADFFTTLFGYKADDRYKLNSDKHFGTYSYMQLYIPGKATGFSLGLFKDIVAPFEPLPQTGTVPSFIVTDINETLTYLQSHHVVIDIIDGKFIQTNVSDEGYEDQFFFFRDPDNNSFVMRQNISKTDC